MKVLVNGEPHDLPAPLSVDALIDQLALERRGLAIAVGSEVVPRSFWPSWWLSDGDHVEILTIAQGG